MRRKGWRDEIARRDMIETEEHSAEIRLRCRTLTGFVQEAWKVLEPRTTYIHNWHIDAICEHLEAVTNHDINRLLINVPPGSMKSLLVSVFWHAWEWGPKALRDYRYVVTSFNDGPVTRDTRKTRDLILSPWYQTLWPEVRLVRAGETSFANSSTGSREAIAFGSLTSQRGDRLILDDPHSVEKAESPQDRLTTTRRFREGALDRINDLEKSAIVVIMQRLHMDDVSGTIEAMPELGYEHLMIPMRLESERRCTTKTMGWTDPRKNDGELMDPIRFPEQEVQKLELGKGEYAWAGQYQQRPAPREGGMFKVDNIEIIDVPPSGSGIHIRGWDIAGSTRKMSPYTAGIKIAVYPNKDVVIMDAKRARVKIGKAEKLIVETAFDDGIGVLQSIPQDPGQAGLSQKNQLSGRLAGMKFRFSPESGAKEDRAIPISSMVEASKVFMMRGPWNAALIEEMRNFPAGSFMDQVDALSRAYAEYLRMPRRRSGTTGPKVGRGR